MALIHCPECSKQVSSSAASCPNCGHPINSASLGQIPSLAKVGETLGVLLVLAPLAAAALSWFWVAQMRLIENPAAKLGLVAISTVLITAILAAIESAQLGVGSDADLAAWKNRNTGQPRPAREVQRTDEARTKICTYCGVENSNDSEKCVQCGQGEFRETEEPKSIRARGLKPPSPVTWLFGVALLWLFVYPTYLYCRSKYGVKNLVGAGLFAMLLFLGTAGYVYVLIGDAHQSLNHELNRSQQELQRLVN